MQGGPRAPSRGVPAAPQGRRSFLVYLVTTQPKLPRATPPQAPPLLTFRGFRHSTKRVPLRLLGMSNFWLGKYSLERLGFLTLTFAQDIKDPIEAQRRFNSLATHVLRDRYADYIRIWERTKKGRIHYHLLVVLPEDIRTGFSFVEAEFGVYTSAPKALRSEWAFWRSTAKEYGFGRTELLPIRSTAEGIARYVGKYISSTWRNVRNGIRASDWSSTAGALGKSPPALHSTPPDLVTGGGSWNCFVPTFPDSKATA